MKFRQLYSPNNSKRPSRRINYNKQVKSPSFLTPITVISLPNYSGRTIQMQLRHRLRKLLIMATTMSARPRWTSLPSGPMSPMKHCSRTMPDLTPHTSKSSGSSPRTASTWRTTLDFHSGRSPITTKKARRDPLKFRAMLTSAQYSTWK